MVLGPALAIGTSLALQRWGVTWTRVFLLADFIYVITLCALILMRVSKTWMARRRNSAGSRLHLRLMGVFLLVALAPTVIVAIFATVSVNLGIENWFSWQIRSVVSNALEAAEAYEDEHGTRIRGDIGAMATDLTRAADAGITQPQMNELVRQQALLRELDEAYVFNSQRQILARGEYSYLFEFEAPTVAQLAEARTGGLVLIFDAPNNEIRALIRLEGFADAYLYVTRDVQGDVLRLLDESRETMQLYDELEEDRDGILFQFALFYLGFAFLVMLAAALLGLSYAERLAKPVGRLVGAAERVGAGDLDTRVKEERGNDEFALLGRVFNDMTEKVAAQRDELLEASREAQESRDFIAAVLSGVSAGVIGLDAEGRIELANHAAVEMLGLEGKDIAGRPLGAVAPAFAALLDNARSAPSGIARGEVRAAISATPREFMARVSARRHEGGDEGFVLTFDDMTALASAQRMAAWADVARRIAHEIKNPLTPIQLSADRLRRKFVKRLAEDAESAEQILDVITRQAGDIRRMVDEFAKFARMPEPEAKGEDLREILRDVVVLQQSARADIAYEIDLPETPALCLCDRGLIGQALTNLLQNAADAIDSRREAEPEAEGRIRIQIERGGRSWRITVTDTGIGLPAEGRERLTDPYVTTRAKGTGLGLAIVRKIAEQHGGDLTLGDAPDGSGLAGAEAVLRLPVRTRRPLATDTSSATTNAPAEVKEGKVA